MTVDRDIIELAMPSCLSEYNNNIISLPDNGDLSDTLDVRNYVSKISDMSLDIVQVAVVLLLWVVVTASILARVAQRTILSNEGV